MAPRVSVVLPVYNAETWLGAAMNSILAQTFTDFELLVHDDGSTDGSLAILQEFAARDPRVVLTSEPNKGLIAVLNQLIAAAQGDLIARMDADDIALPERFAKQVAWLDQNKEYVLLGSSTLMIDADGRPIGVNAAPQGHDTIDDNNLRGITAFEHPSVLMRRTAVLAAGGYHAAFPHAEDIDLWLRLAEVGRVENLADVLLKYRVHDQSISALKQDEQIASCRRACEDAWARRGVTASFDHKPWRMEQTRASRCAYYVKYGWKAWHFGFRDTWRHYALRAVQTNPASVPAWKLLVLGALRRPARPAFTGEIG